jgi:hypothetical protein
VLTTQRFIKIIHLGMIFFLWIGLAGCNSPSPIEPTEPPVLETSPAALPTATATMAPTPTAQPPLVILFAPQGSDPAQLEGLQAVLTDLTAKDGLRFETRKEIVEGGIDESVQLVVVLPPYPEIAQLAALYPQTNFLAIGFPDLQASQNLVVISSGGGRPDQQGFLAGYIAVVITSDWRVGVISSADSEVGKAASQGFTNGAIFFCGLCRPAYPPFNQYPMVVELPAGASQDQQIAAADTLINSAVQTVYIAPGAGGGALLEYLAQAGVNLIGGDLPPVQVQDRWVVTIQTDLVDTVEQNWEALLSGETGFSMDSPLVLMDINEALFSPGRQKLVDKTMADLLAGFIDTGVAP